MLIGYARISKADGSHAPSRLDLQRDALREHAFSDTQTPPQCTPSLLKASPKGAPIPEWDPKARISLPSQVSQKRSFWRRQC